MNAREVDERDGQWESQSIGYRVMIVKEGGVHWIAYDMESDSLSTVEQWARDNSEQAEYSIAARVEADGGVGLIWLTPPPESFLDART
ncbi:hypothetical protein ELQ92_00630 [Labedella populi]|uniref:Uncharacterized protein n=1 Tax=Labedella populi TaxID=2498850 RepID=A0A444QE59_9MICO|nr:hypothetical protein [Labedella populi]RWZ67814.1 hypothetical protein ELQ92_00630 [Labedella populi]